MFFVCAAPLVFFPAATRARLITSNLVHDLYFGITGCPFLWPYVWGAPFRLEVLQSSVRRKSRVCTILHAPRVFGTPSRSQRRGPILSLFLWRNVHRSCPR